MIRSWAREGSSSTASASSPNTAGKLGNLSVYGQESNPTTWRLAAVNMAICGIDFNLGKEPAHPASRGSAMVQREASTQVVHAAEDNFTSDRLGRPQPFN